MTSERVFKVEPVPSRQGTVLLIALAGIALAGVLPLPWPQAAALCAAIISYAVWSVWRLRTHPLRALHLHQGRGASLVFAHRREPLLGVVTDDAFVSPWLICMGVRCGARRHNLCFFPDTLLHDDYRRLSAWLKHP